jgi:hypothetical protein
MNRYLTLNPVEPLPTNLLTSETHVTVIMELVGQGFNLPLNNLSIIDMSVYVYSTWLLQISKRPIVMKNSISEENIVQRFIQNMFKQSSLLFRVRQPNELHSPSKKTNEDVYENVKEHIELCKKVVGVYASCVREHSVTFSEETWMVILKVLLGICDSLLRDPIVSKKGKNDFEIEQVGMYIGDQLCEILIGVSLFVT